MAGPHLTIQSALLEGSLRLYFGLANEQIQIYEQEVVRRAVVSQPDSFKSWAALKSFPVATLNIAVCCLLYQRVY